MLSVVLTEYEVFEATVFVDYGKGIELMLPDNIVCFLESSALGCR